MSFLSNMKDSLSMDERILTKKEMKNIQGGSSYGYGVDGCSMTRCGGVCYSDTTGSVKGNCTQFVDTNGSPVCKCVYH